MTDLVGRIGKITPKKLANRLRVIDSPHADLTNEITGAVSECLSGGGRPVAVGFFVVTDLNSFRYVWRDTEQEFSQFALQMGYKSLGVYLDT